MNAVLLFFTTLFAVGYTPNASANILSEIDGLTLDVVYSEALPNEDRQVNERVMFDFTLYFTYEDMNTLIEELTIYNDTVEIIVSYTDIGGPGPFIDSRRINMTSYDIQIYNGVLSGFIFIEYLLNYRDLNGDHQTFNSYQRSFSIILEQQTENMTLEPYALSFEISTGDTEAYQEGYTDGYEDGRESGYNEGYEDGETDGREIGFNEGQIDGYNRGYSDGLANTDVVDSAISLVKGVFSGLDTLLNIEIIPGLKLSIILLVPIVFGVVSFFLNLWR